MLTSRSVPALAVVVVLTAGATGGCDIARAVVAPGPGPVVMLKPEHDPVPGRSLAPVSRLGAVAGPMPAAAVKGAMA